MFRKLSAGLLLSICCLNSRGVRAGEFNVGFNQAWINGAYSHQWLDADYKEEAVDKILDKVALSGGKIVRIWLFEGPESNALRWTNGKVSGIHPQFLKNFEKFIQEAKARDLKVYPTFFDGNQFGGLRSGPINDRWKKLLNDEDNALASFRQRAMAPLMELLYKPEYRKTIFGIDVMNEIDAAVVRGRFSEKWEGVNHFVCELREAIRFESGNVLEIPVTASIGWPFIPLYSRGARNLILDPNPRAECVDFWDVHFYNNSGNIPNCERIREIGQRYRKKIYLGEFGQLTKRYDDDMQLNATANFVRNAKACGFAGALAWVLSDMEDGQQTEPKYHSFMARGGAMRPAYDWIKRWNASETDDDGDREPSSVKSRTKKSNKKTPKK